MNKTAISWAERTWNPITGCTKVSPGCAHCYAESIMLRFKRGPAFLPGNDSVFLHPDRLDQPMSFRDPAIIFTCSMSDIFHEDVPLEFLEEIFGVMANCHQHQFLLLTKRAERMKEVMTNPPWRWPLPNVWLGVSAENQRMAEARIPLLLDVDAPIHYVSAEPLLRSLDLRDWLRCQVCSYTKQDHVDAWSVLPRMTAASVGDGHAYVGLDWLIVGGESGAKARPMHPEWAEVLAVQAAAAGIAFHFKQWGTWAPWGGRGRPAIFTEEGRFRTNSSMAHGDILLSRTRKSDQQAVLLGQKRQEWPPYQRSLL